MKQSGILCIIGAILLSSYATMSYSKKASATIYSYPDNLTLERLILEKGQEQLTIENVTLPYKVPSEFMRGRQSVLITGVLRSDLPSAHTTMYKKANPDLWKNVVWLPFFWVGLIVDVSTGSNQEPLYPNYVLNFGSQVKRE